MTKVKTAALGLAIAAFAAGGTLAQTNSDGSMSGSGNTSTSGSMSTGGMSSGDAMSTSKMSKADMATMKRCQAMSHDVMMKDSKCMKMMKMHPEMMNNSPPMSH